MAALRLSSDIDDTDGEDPTRATQCYAHRCHFHNEPVSGNVVRRANGFFQARSEAHCTGGELRRAKRPRHLKRWPVTSNILSLL